jgi:hypothetical protein
VDRDGDDDAVIREAMSALSPEGSLVTHWIMVMEVLVGEDLDLHVATSEGMTPWLMMGMMDAVRTMASEDD